MRTMRKTLVAKSATARVDRLPRLRLPWPWPPLGRGPLLAGFSPPPTPVVQRGTGSNAASAKKGRPAYSPSSSSTSSTSARGGKIVDKPVTFRENQSSGYGQTPSTALGALEKKRKDRLKQAIKDRQLKRSSTAPAAVSAPQLRTYPTDCAPMHVHQKHSDHFFGAAETGSAPALYRLRFSEDGSWLGVPSSDCAVTTLKTPLSRFKGDGSFYVSHNRAVTAVEFSHEREPGVEGGAAKQLVLSSSLDGTARLWKGGKVDGAAVVSPTRGAAPPAGAWGRPSAASSIPLATPAVTPAKRLPSLPPSGATALANGQVVDASFYYSDKFVVLGNENRLFMYNYRTESAHEQNDLKRLHSSRFLQGSAPLVVPRLQSVTAIRCVNSVLSPLLFCASSDRSLHVCDTVSGSVTRSIPGAHDRAIHCIALPQPSVYAQLDQAAYNVFATAAMDNSVLVWDLRSPTVGLRYTGHQPAGER